MNQHDKFLDASENTSADHAARADMETTREDFKIWDTIIQKYIGPSYKEILVLPEGITYIYGDAFSRCKTQFTTVILPDSLTKISDQAFSGFINLREIIHTEHIEAVGSSALADTAITQIDLPNVKSLGYRSFYDCENLETVRLSEKLTSMPEQCFAYCKALKEFTVPQGVERMAANAFSGTEMSLLRLPDTLLQIEWGTEIASVQNVVIDENNPKYYVEDGQIKRRPYHEEGGLYTTLENPTAYDLAECTFVKRVDRAYSADDSSLRLKRIRYSEEEMNRFAAECSQYVYHVKVEHIEGNDDYNREEVLSTEEMIEEIPMQDVVIAKGKLFGFYCAGEVIPKEALDCVVSEDKNYTSLSYYRYEEDTFYYQVFKR